MVDTSKFDVLLSLTKWFDYLWFVDCFLTA